MPDRVGEDQSWWDGRGPYQAAALALLALACALSLLGLRRDLWLDEYLSLTAVRLPTWGAMLAELRNDTSPPLYFILLRLWTAVSLADAWLRLFSVVMYVATLGVVLAWLKPLSRPGSLVGTAFLATFPLVFRYAVEVRMYGLLLLCTAVAFLGAGRLAREPRRTSGPLLLGLGLAAATATHLIGCFLILPCLAYLLGTRPQGTRLPWGRLLLAEVMPAALFLWIYFFYLDPEELQHWWMPRVSWPLFWRGVWQVIDFLARLGPLGAMYGTSPSLAAAVVLLAIALAALCLALFVTAGELRRTLPFFVAAALYGVQLLTGSLLVTPMLWDRTLLPVMVPLAGFMGLQAVTLRWPWLRLAFGALSVFFALAFSLTWAFYWSPRHTEENRRLAQLLAREWHPGAPVVFYPSWAAGPVRHYFPGLPTTTVLPVKPGGEGPQLREALARLSSSPGPGSPLPRLFLVVRLDPLLAQRLEALQELVAALQPHLRQGASLQVFLSFDAHINLHPGLLAAREEILKDLEGRFGPPGHFQKSEAFYWLIYNSPLVGPALPG